MLKLNLTLGKALREFLETLLGELLGEIIWSRLLLFSLGIEDEPPSDPLDERGGDLEDLIGIFREDSDDELLLLLLNSVLENTD